jgi:6-phosphofructokinase 2
MEQLTGKSLDPEQAGEEALKIIQRGNVENIAVSMGGQGALLATASGVHFASAPTVKLGSAVGAGDSFVAAMTFALANDIAVEEAFHLGIAAGSAAVMTTGTQLCRREDVIRLYRQESMSRDRQEANRLLSVLDTDQISPL